MASDPFFGVDVDDVISTIRVWQAFTEEHTAPDPEPGSSLFGDGARSPVYQVGHLSWSSFVQAIDHLHAMQTLIFDAGITHAVAPFSLLRSAMDSASVALWLLAPTSRPERLTRRLHLARQDLWEADEARRSLGKDEVLQPVVATDTQRADIEVLAKSLNLDAGRVGGRFIGYGRIVRQAAESTPGLDPNLTEFLWRSCSGLAHGRQWASLALLVQDRTTRSPGVSNMRLSSDKALIMLITETAPKIAVHAQSVYEQRRIAL